MGKNKDARERSNANLQMFTQGKSGNPAGRPIGSPDGPAARLRRILKRKAHGRRAGDVKRAKLVTNNATVQDVALAALAQKAMAGNMQAIALLFEFLEVRPAQALKLMGGDGGPIKFNSAGAIERLESLLARLGEDQGADPADARPGRDDR